MEVLAADSIFGHLLLEYQRWRHAILPVDILDAHVTYVVTIVSLHLSEMISFVRVA